MATVTIDVEIYPNFALIGVRDFDSGEVLQFSTEPGIGDSLEAARAWYRTVKNTTLFVGFNSSGYDNIMLRAMLVEGVEDTAELFALSKATIA